LKMLEEGVGGPNNLSDALWTEVNYCCPQKKGPQKLCVEDGGKYKYYVVKDASTAKPNALLIVPNVEHLTGIDDPKITASPYVDYWQYGLVAINDHLKPKSKELGMAINSRPAMTQDVLHIHLSCARDDVLSALDNTKISTDPNNPTSLNLGPHKNGYEAVTVAQLTGPTSPYNLVAKFPHVKGDMKDQSIAVIKSKKTSGTYYVVDTYHHDKNPGEAEELLDQTSDCK
jgi:CDP-diacylglycerol pyrophosphatase